MQAWDDTKQAALENAWLNYRRWAITARNATKRIKAGTGWVFKLTILGSMLCMISQLLKTWSNLAAAMEWAQRGLGIAGAIALAFAAYFTRELLTDEAQKRWLRSRGAAEGIKSECYLFRLGAPPYDAADAGQRLLTNIQERRKLVNGMTHDTASDAELRKDLPQGLLTLEGYIKDRVQDQIDFYDGRVGEYQQSLSQNRMQVIVLGAVSVALGFVAGWWASPAAAIIAFIATLTAALNSHVASSRYGYLVVSYQAVSDQLRDLKQLWPVTRLKDDPSAQALFAKSCESAMAAENNAWMAKLSERPPENTGAQAPALTQTAVKDAGH